MTPATREDGWSRLRAWMATLEDLAGTARMLEWDRETAMPAGASVGRGHQIATLYALRHREVLAPGIDDVIEQAAATTDGSPAEAAMLRLARRERLRAQRLPERLVREQSEASTAGVAAWLDTRDSGDFAAFAPALERVVAVTREVGAALAIGDEPYDGLLDEYEPGLRAAQLEPLFAQLSAEVAALVASVPRHPAPTTFVGRSWPDESQFAFAREIAALVGFRFDTGTVARSAHPFTTTVHAGDVRFTTRIAPDDPTGNVLATMHEAGHALYSQGHPQQYARTLIYSSPSLGAEESQSRFLENHIGRSAEFWQLMAPRMAGRFGPAMDGIGADDLHAAVTRMAPGWCRVDADELTYDLHIALRTTLELQLIRGQLAVTDLPDAWREQMQRTLGVTPANDREGCMQDIHWAWGSFGYFPTYTLGNLYAAQLAEAMGDAIGEVGDLVARGELTTIIAFLHDRVHRHGSILPTDQLMQQATGQPFSIEPFLRRIARLAADAR